jgi:hypothetical protein
MERFSLKVLSKGNVREEYHLRIFGASQLWRTYEDSRDINRARETIRDSMKTSANESIGQYEQKQA